MHSKSNLILMSVGLVFFATLVLIPKCSNSSSSRHLSSFLNTQILSNKGDIPKLFFKTEKPVQTSRHGLKNPVQTIFRRYFEYWMSPKGYWASIMEEYWKHFQKITKILTIYQFGTNKSTKKLSVKRCAEQRKKLVKISEIYWKIFLKVFF